MLIGARSIGSDVARRAYDASFALDIGCVVIPFQKLSAPREQIKKVSKEIELKRLVRLAATVPDLPTFASQLPPGSG